MSAEVIEQSIPGHLAVESLTTQPEAQLRLLALAQEMGAASIGWAEQASAQEELRSKNIVSSPAALLELSNPSTGVTLLKLNKTVPNPQEVLTIANTMPAVDVATRESVSMATLDVLATHNLHLSAPVAAGSEGADKYDKTQRSRRMFIAGNSGGAASHESYASQLFTAASNPELIEAVASNLSGKNILNLGGGNAQLTQELQAAGAKDVTVANVEPYPSQMALDNPADFDPIIEANPAKKDFMEKAGIPAHSADEAWSVFAVPAYLGSVEEIDTLFNNLAMAIKPSGVIRLSHFGVVDTGDKALDARRQAALRENVQKMAEQGFLVEMVKTNASTLVLTAPETFR